MTATRPPAFPWLDHLRKDRRGLPVPFINTWGPETAETTRVAHDPLVGGQATFIDDHGDVPDFTRQSPQRQRQCMVEGLCQVCGKPVPWSRRNLVVADLAVEWVYVNELRREVPVVMEPWLCNRCCDIAVNWCPALIRRERTDNLHVVPVRSQREAQMIVSVGAVSLPGYEWTYQKPVRMWVKARLLATNIERAPKVPERCDPAANVHVSPHQGCVLR